jgi:hypothetical protein
MYCPKCGSENEENAQACLACGEVLQAVVMDGSGIQKIPNYLAQSILVTVFCCQWLGIPGIVYAAQVNTKAQGGDLEGAWAASRKAKMWCWWSFGIGLAYVMLYVGYMAVVFGLAAASGR